MSCTSWLFNVPPSLIGIALFFLVILMYFSPSKLAAVITTSESSGIWDRMSRFTFIVILTILPFSFEPVNSILSILPSVMPFSRTTVPGAMAAESSI